MARPPRQVIEFRLYELDLEFPVLLLSGDLWHISDVPSARMHFHNCLELGVCHSDHGTLVIHDEKRAFRTGDVTCVPRHVPHTTYSAPGESSLWSYLFVDLQELLFDMLRIQEDLTLTSLVSESFQYLMHREEYPKVYSLVNCILSEMEERKPNYRMAVKGLFVALFFELLRIQKAKAAMGTGEARAHKDTMLLAPALNFIHNHYPSRMTVEQLATMCHLSATHFRRVFLSIMGTSPLSYINATRIDHACILLRTTETPILDIAEAVGFSSISSFHRCFAHIMGMPPRDYRNPALRVNAKREHKYILQYSGWVKADR